MSPVECQMMEGGFGVKILWQLERNYIYHCLRKCEDKGTECRESMHAYSRLEACFQDLHLHPTIWPSVAVGDEKCRWVK